MDFRRLCDRLSLDNSHTRLASLAQLEQAGDELVLPSSVVDALLGCLGDRNKAVQRRAAQQLVRFSSRQPAIVELLRDRLT
ncbi:MAG: hypothetical protein J4F42_16065, partial [Desulfurellaceae bacterium]|nr:hypothetical protein [Desulfurellaceae bacterium]